MKQLLILLLFICWTKNSFSQYNFTFSINGEAPSSVFYPSYEFNGKKLIVREFKTTYLFPNDIRFDTVFEKTLTQLEIKQLYTAYKEIEFVNLKESYSTPGMDGVTFIFDFMENEKRSYISLRNYYMYNFDKFLRVLNPIISQEYRFIAFDDDLYFTPDTLVHFLPEFALDTSGIPKQYESYQTKCASRDNYRYEYINQPPIRYCRCRLSPKRNLSRFKERDLWNAIKTDSSNWVFTKYNFKSKEVDSIEYTIPYPLIIINEKVKQHDGYRPSRIIYKYYKLEQR